VIVGERTGRRGYCIRAIATAGAAGFADFSLIAFHFQKAGGVTQSMVPVFYSAAMVTGAVGSPILGRLLDRLGVPVILAALFLSAFFAPLVFLGGSGTALAGMILWGLGMGVQESALKAILAAVVRADLRSTAFGVFGTSYGIAWACCTTDLFRCWSFSQL
jgi:MFS family permease